MPRTPAFSISARTPSGGWPARRARKARRRGSSGLPVSPGSKGRRKRGISETMVRGSPPESGRIPSSSGGTWRRSRGRRAPRTNSRAARRGCAGAGGGGRHAHPVVVVVGPLEVDRPGAVGGQRREARHLEQEGDLPWARIGRLGDRDLQYVVGRGLRISRRVGDHDGPRLGALV